mgnify:CR=1 FL=1
MIVKARRRRRRMSKVMFLNVRLEAEEEENGLY